MHSTFEIQLIEKKTIWEEFVQTLKPETFLHSWGWGEFNASLGTKIFRLGIFQGEKLVATALILKIEAKRGTFLFCPHGPIVQQNVDEEEVMKALTIYLQDLGKKERCDFVRISPLFEKSEAYEKIFQTLSYRQAPVHMMHPELGWILDIQPDNEELLKNMRKTTRYCIRKAEKDGVTISSGSEPEDIEKFWKVYQATVDRQHFTPFSKKYLQSEISAFRPDQILLFFAHYNNEIVATAIIVFYGGSAFYHHGASVHTYPKITAPYLLQWHIIQEAKRRNCHAYNFWGVVHEDQPKHPWAGLSLFKKGFGGSSKAYVHAKDFPLTQKYWLNWMIERLRRWKRRL